MDPELEIIKDFNKIVLTIVDFVKSIYKNETELYFYRELCQNIIIDKPEKLIENFIINCLHHKEHIINKNYNHFLTYNPVIKKSRNLLGVLKMKDKFPELSENIKSLIFDYLIILTNHSINYFKLKYVK